MAADQGAGFEQYRRPTKRDVFLETMEQIVPWAQLCEVVEPYYPKGGATRAAPGFFGHRFGVKRVIQTGVADVEES
jgi:IS5 family transposase